MSIYVCVWVIFVGLGAKFEVMHNEREQYSSDSDSLILI